MALVAAIGGPLWTDVAQTVAAVTGVIGVVAALVFSAEQTRRQRREYRRSVAVQRAQLDLDLMSKILALDQVFVERPRLYPYFNENRPLPQDDVELRNEALLCAELVIDVVGTVGVQAKLGQITAIDLDEWASFLRTYYAESPAVRAVFKRFEPSPGETTRFLLGVDEWARSAARVTSEQAGDAV